MKKRLIIEVICGIFIFTVGYFIGDSSAIKRVNNQIDQKVTSQQNNSAEKKEDAQSTSKEDKIYKMGEEGASGNWNIKVLEVKEANTIQAGNSSDNKTTSEKFIIVKVQMKNISKQPAQYSPNEFALGNIKDKSQYNSNLDAIMTANQKETIYNRNGEFISIYTDVNPNTSKKTYIVFEVPKSMNASDAVLINANGNAEATGFYIK